MRFVHEIKCHAALSRIFGGNLAPDIGKLYSGRPVLTNDLAIEPRVVVQVNKTKRGTRI